jgi:iron complex outermembrane receptor protein
MFSTNSRKTLVAATLLALLPLRVFAQTENAQDETSDKDSVLEEVIVTANLRETRLQDVPLGITALSGEKLIDQRIVDLQDLSTRVPGLSFQRGIGQGTSGPNQRIVIRGLNTGGAGATVASVVDDVPLSFSSAISNGADFAADFEPYDMSRVEVLRGPQGTLYGANAEGGLIKYVSNAPNTQQASGRLDLGGYDLAHASDFGGFVKGYVNTPFADGSAAFRATGYYESVPGWIDNELGGQKNINENTRYGGRFSLLFQPTDKLSLTATALLQQLDGDGSDTVEVVGVADPSDPFRLIKGYNFDTYVAQPFDSKSQVYSFNLDYQFDGFNFKSITSYGILDTQYDFDTPLYVPLSGLFFGRPNTTLLSRSISQLDKFNQEFRLSSDNDAASQGRGFEWLLGAFYTKETSEFFNDYYTLDATTGEDVTTPISPTTSQVFLGGNEADYNELAAYADFIYHFTNSFRIEFGARVFRNEQKFAQSTGGALFFPPEFITVYSPESSETEWTYSLAPSFDISDNSMVYGRIASGYRPGGPNPIIPPAGPNDPPGQPPTSFTSDSTVNYEIGYKGASASGEFAFDVAAFYIDWTDIQVSAVVPRGLTGYNATLNAGEAVSKGFEWTFNWYPTEGLSLGLLGAYTDATLKGDVSEINGFDGDELPYVPDWTTTVTAEYEWQTSGSYQAYVGGNLAYVGDKFTNFNFRPALTHLEMPSYETWGLQAGLRGDRYTFELYGKNLSDERGITSYSGGQTIFGIVIPGAISIIRPREIGLRFTALY